MIQLASASLVVMRLSAMVLSLSTVVQFLPVACRASEEAVLIDAAVKRVRSDAIHVGESLLTTRVAGRLTEEISARLACPLIIVEVTTGGVRSLGNGRAIVERPDHPSQWRIAVDRETRATFRLRGFGENDYEALARRCGLLPLRDETAVESFAELAILLSYPGVFAVPVHTPAEVDQAVHSLLAEVGRDCRGEEVREYFQSPSGRIEGVSFTPRVVRSDTGAWSASVLVVSGNAVSAELRRPEVRLGTRWEVAFGQEGQLTLFPERLLQPCSH